MDLDTGYALGLRFAHPLLANVAGWVRSGALINPHPVLGDRAGERSRVSRSQRRTARDLAHLRRERSQPSTDNAPGPASASATSAQM